MTQADYEYKGLMAQAWDLLRGDTSQWADRFYYLEAIRRFGQPALDIGCATGRLLLDYLAQGIDIDGVDNSPEILAVCAANAERRGLAPRLYQQNMEMLDLPRRYRTILIPSSSLQLIIDPAEVDRALGRIYACLEPGGAVVASIMRLWSEGEPLESEWEISAVSPEDGATIKRIARSRFDPGIDCEHTDDTYQVIVDGQIVAEEHHSRSPATRSYTQSQSRALFERAGFEDIALNAEFTWESAQPAHTLWTVVARRASS